MRTRVLRLAAGSPPAIEPEPEWAGADLVLAFLPPGEGVAATLEAVAGAFPAARVAGCEAVTQFAGDRLATAGTLHLFRFDDDATEVDLRVIHNAGGTLDADDLHHLAARLAAGDPSLLLVDGLRCPVQEGLAALRQELVRCGVGTPPPLAGGLASQPVPVEGVGARVFADGEVLEGGCVAVSFRGVAAIVDVVRGWDPASPEYEVTRAEGNVLYEIEGRPAAAWLRRFFTVDDELAPLPDTAHRFPLIVEGPEPARHGLYRSLRAFDEPPGALTFWGDLATGDRVRLGMGNEASLVRRAEEMAASRGLAAPEAALLFSCVGREQVLGHGEEGEVAAVQRALGASPVSGFFSFGEIGPTPGGGPAFYNHTAILVLLAEEGTAP